MKNVFKSVLLLSILMLSSCNDDIALEKDSTNTTVANNEISSKKMILVRKRAEPAIISTGIDSVYRQQDANLESILLRASSTTNLGNLGSGFKLDNKFPLETPLNMTFSVVDPNKIYAADSSNISINNILTTDKSYSAFATSDYYFTNSEVSKTIKGSASGSIGSLISAGVSSTYKEVFKTSTSNENQSVYGELSIYINRYRLALNQGEMYNYSERYITNGFRNTLYENSIMQTMNIYGTHVLSDYLLGGAAKALYKGVSKTTTNAKSKETDLEIALKGSFLSFSSSGSFGLTTKSKDSVAAKFSKVDISVKTIGGETGHGIAAFTTPGDLSQTSIDLSTWAKSVNNSNAIINHINPNGLVPLYEFVLEDNFKRKIKEKLGSPKYNTPLSEPYVGYCLLYPGNSSYIGTFLNTRHGTYILIGLKEIPNDRTNHLSYIFQLATGNDLPDGRVPAKTYGESMFEELSAYIYEEPWLDFSNLNDLYTQYYDLTNIDKNSMKLCQIEGQIIKYLTFNSNSKKYALGIHADYIFDTYGLEKYKNLKVEKISTLRGYTVLGL